MRVPRRVVRLLGPLLGTALLVVAIVVLRRELSHTTLRDIGRELRALPLLSLLLSVALTILGYLALGLQDLLAIRHLGKPISAAQAMIASMVGYAFANTIPLAVFIGGTVRYRFYSRWGVSPSDTASLMLFNVFTYALGLAAAAAVIFTLEPTAVPVFLRLGTRSTRPLGIAAGVLVAAYVLWCAAGPRLKVGQIRLEPVPPRVALQQLAVSLLDWGLSGLALYVLFPAGHPVALADFFGAFLLGQMAALVTQLPGGIGVFEAVMIAILSHQVPVPALFGALLAYRVIYYLLPLIVAVVYLGTREALRLAKPRA